MKSIFKIVAVAICLGAAVGSHQASAQKVYASGGKVYIDCGPGTGFPQGAVTTASKIQAGTPTDTDLFLPFETNGPSGTINATVYRKFEVAKVDAPAATWAAAYIYCRDTYPATGGGTGWRLPTQRELMLVWIFRSALTNLGCAALGSGVYWGDAVYWSAMESGALKAWYVSFIHGGSYNGYTKADTFGSRCVREVAAPLPPPLMVYGQAPFSAVGDLVGSTTSSYNSWTGTVADGRNGAYQTSSTNAYANEQPFHRLEVALESENGDAAIAGGWAAARTLCASKTTNGGGWRLPRISELHWIYLNRAALEAVPGFVALGSSIYWSATEYNATNAWYVIFSNGSTSYYTKTSTGYKSRCVREGK